MSSNLPFFASDGVLHGEHSRSESDANRQLAAAVIATNPRLNRAIQLHLDARADRVRAENALSVLKQKEQLAHRELVMAKIAAGIGI